MQFSHAKTHKIILTAAFLLLLFSLARSDFPVQARELRTLETGINEMNQQVLLGSPNINDPSFLNAQNRIPETGFHLKYFFLGAITFGLFILITWLVTRPPVQYTRQATPVFKKQPERVVLNSLLADKKASEPNRTRRNRLLSRYKVIFRYTWPFIVLAVILVFGWDNLRPYISNIWRRVEVVKEKMLGDGDVYANRDPDAEYRFYNDRIGLKAAETAGELGLKEGYAESDTLPKGKKVKNLTELAQAIAVAEPDDIIILLPGEYRMNLEVEKDIYIIGTGAGTILTAKDENQPIISARDKSIGIENMVIKDGRIGIAAYGNELTVGRIRFENLFGTACYARDTTLNFVQSWIYDSNSAVKAVDSEGKIMDSIIRNNMKAGVELRHSKFQINRNIIENNGSYGVYADGESEVTIEENYIEGNKGFNVRIENRKEIYR